MPYLLDSTVYAETENIALGNIEKSAFLSELSDWFILTYSIEILNVQLEKIIGPGAERYKINVIIENLVDYQKIDVQPTFPQRVGQQLQIGLEFKRLALKHDAFDQTKLDDLPVTYIDFSREAKTETNRRAAKEVATHIKSAHVSVWDVVTQFWGSVVFYYSDYDIKNNERTGTSALITNGYYKILKKYDKFNYFTRENISLKFDSKENLDKNFEGNLFYYSR